MMLLNKLTTLTKTIRVRYFSWLRSRQQQQIEANYKVQIYRNQPCPYCQTLESPIIFFMVCDLIDQDDHVSGYGTCSIECRPLEVREGTAIVIAERYDMSLHELVQVPRCICGVHYE